MIPKRHAASTFKRPDFIGELPGNYTYILQEVMLYIDEVRPACVKKSGGMNKTCKFFTRGAITMLVERSAFYSIPQQLPQASSPPHLILWRRERLHHSHQLQRLH